MSLDLHGKVAVVTGASAGIGEAAAKALADAGMHVVVSARREDRLETLAASHPRIVAQPADVTSGEDVSALAKRVEDDFGACHVLVNNAGSSFGNRLRAPEDLDDLIRTMDLNLVGAARCMATFAPLMFRSAPGRVINVASVAGKIGVGPPAYAASKFALVGLSEATRLDWIRRGVTVSQLNPGYIATEQFPQTGLLRSPLGRLMVSRPEKVGAAILDVARSGVHERTVPRWYRIAPVFRHLAAPLYWTLTHRSGTGEKVGTD
jgi:NAD(P)-dependent dehydrogenase (short-subunit alcohol dehydrogenase family)